MTSEPAAAKKQDSSGPASAFATAVSGFAAALEECVQTANEEAVHRVRTGSRRVQAMLEAMQRQTRSEKDTVKDWLRLLKKVRRAAGEVRDLDVHRKLLAHYAGKEPHALAKQAKQLDEWLEKERRHRARRMVKEMRKRQKSLLAIQESFLAGLGSPRKSRKQTAVTPEAVALEDFMRAVDKMPVLDAENLHDFRKATKKARYVAESGAVGTVSRALKRVQDTIGEWHDWLCLQQEAQVALKGEAPELTALLEHEVDQHFVLAMKTTQTIRARLTGEWMAKRPGKQRMAG